jgi:hypothetical protein
MQQAWQTDGGAGHHDQNCKRSYGHPDSAMSRRRLDQWRSGGNGRNALCGGLSGDRDSYRRIRSLFPFCRIVLHRSDLA